MVKDLIYIYSGQMALVTSESLVDVTARIANSQVEGGEGYSVFAYYLNHDLADHSRPQRPYGIVVPCGTYRTPGEAEMARDRLSVETGAPVLVCCRNRRPHALRLTPGDDSLVYPRQVGASLDEITSSMEREKQRQRDIQRRLQVEVQEREDPTTMSYLINAIYRLNTSSTRLESLRKELLQTESDYIESLGEVAHYFQAHPEVREQWKEETRTRLAERQEMDTFTTMVSSMEGLWPEIERVIRENGRE